MERLFLAFGVSDQVREACASVQEQLRGQMRYSRVVWVAPENFHITIHFLGDVALEEREALTDSLQQLVYPGSFDLALRGVSAFPSKKRPQTIFVETSIHPFALAIRQKTGAVLAEMGFEIDERPWRSHITIGRVKVQSEVLKPEEVTMRPLPWTVNEVRLMRSTLTSEGSLYEIVESVAL